MPLDFRDSTLNIKLSSVVQVNYFSYLLSFLLHSRVCPCNHVRMSVINFKRYEVRMLRIFAQLYADHFFESFVVSSSQRCHLEIVEQAHSCQLFLLRQKSRKVTSYTYRLHFRSINRRLASISVRNLLTFDVAAFILKTKPR